MPIIDQPTPGSFCWMELGTTDQNAAKQFHSSLFGWTSQDFPMGPSGVYTIFQLNGRDCAAAFTLNKEMLDRGVPPHWMPYVAVESADASTAKAQELGATVLAGPFDVMDKGRMSVIRDSVGAHLSLWQAMASKGIGIEGEPNAYCWADLCCGDRDGAKKFYGALFGWKFVTGEGKDDSSYWHIVNGEKGVGGIPPAAFLPPDVPPHWMLYFQVADCDASYAKAMSLGARGLVPPMSPDKNLRIAILDDPQGAGLAFFQGM